MEENMEEGGGGWGEGRRASRSSLAEQESRPFGIATSDPFVSSSSAANGNATLSANGAGASLSRERIVEVYEHQRWSRKADGWIASSEPHHRAPWCTGEGLPFQPPEEIDPPPDYGWVSNWRIDRGSSATTATAVAGSNETSEGQGQNGQGVAGRHDRQGWEYSTTDEKLGRLDRSPRGIEKWSDRARRRRWIRVARYKTLLGDAAAMQELRKQVQEGLKGLVRGRRMVLDLVEMVGSQRDSSALRLKLFNVIDLVRHHGREVKSLLKAVERDQLPGAKKMRNDLGKEQRAFEDVVKEVERKDRVIPVPQEDATTYRSAAEAVANGEGGGETLMSTTISAGRSAFRMATTAMTSGDEMMEGMYISKDAQSQMILSQMQFEDEEVVMEAIARERGEVVDEVTRSIVELRNIFQDFATLVQEQQAGIDAIVQNTDTAHARTEQAYQSIVKANQMQKESTCRIS